LADFAGMIASVVICRFLS